VSAKSEICWRGVRVYISSRIMPLTMRIVCS